jgi:flagellar motor switch protein FliN/FliY
MAERMGPETTVRPAQLAELTPDAGPGDRTSNLELVLDIEVPVTVELGQASVRIEDLLALHVGAVLELDRRAGDAVDILVNGQPIARGEVVVVDDAFGVRITSISEPAQRVRSLNPSGTRAA